MEEQTLNAVTATNMIWPYSETDRLGQGMRPSVEIESQLPYHAGVITAPEAPKAPIRLTQLSRGQSARLDSSSLASSETEALRAMGLRPECELRVCKLGEPCIVSIGSKAGGCRIALARRLAEHLHVRPC